MRETSRLSYFKPIQQDSDFSVIQANGYLQAYSLIR